MDEKAAIPKRLGDIQNGQFKKEQTKSRLDDIYTISDGLKKHPID